MGRKTNIASAEAERGWFKLERRSVAARFAFALGMITITGATIADNDGSKSAGAALIDSSTSTQTTSTEMTTTTLEQTTHTIPVPVPAPELPEIVDQLGEYGLSLAPDPQNINFPDQIFVTADGECAVQQGVADLPGREAIVSAYLFGPIYAMQDREIIDLDGTQRAHTAHAESSIAIGQTFDTTTEAGLDNALSYMAETTHFLCDGFEPPYLAYQE